VKKSLLKNFSDAIGVIQRRDLWPAIQDIGLVAEGDLRNKRIDFEGKSAPSRFASIKAGILGYRLLFVHDETPQMEINVALAITKVIYKIDFQSTLAKVGD
jgi:hypothetical protein